MAAIKTLIELLRDLREDKDLSQRQVAAMLGISQQQYSQYETGVNELPLRHLVRLAAFYDVSADYLLGRTEKEESASYENVYLTRNCSCRQLMDQLLSLDKADRQRAVEYVEMLCLRRAANSK